MSGMEREFISSKDPGVLRITAKGGSPTINVATLTGKANPDCILAFKITEPKTHRPPVRKPRNIEEKDKPVAKKKAPVNATMVSRKVPVLELVPGLTQPEYRVDVRNGSPVIYTGGERRFITARLLNDDVLNVAVRKEDGSYVTLRLDLRSIYPTKPSVITQRRPFPWGRILPPAVAFVGALALSSLNSDRTTIADQKDQVSPPEGVCFVESPVEAPTDTLVRIEKITEEIEVPNTPAKIIPEEITIDNNKVVTDTIIARSSEGLRGIGDGIFEEVEVQLGDTYWGIGNKKVLVQSSKNPQALTNVVKNWGRRSYEGDRSLSDLKPGDKVKVLADPYIAKIVRAYESEDPQIYRDIEILANPSPDTDIKTDPQIGAAIKRIEEWFYNSQN